MIIGSHELECLFYRLGGWMKLKDVRCGWHEPTPFWQVVGELMERWPTHHDLAYMNDLAYTSKVTSERVPIFFCVCHWHVGQTEAFDRLWEMLRCPCSGDAGNTKHSSQLLQLNREILHPQRSTMCGEGRQTKCMLTGVLPVSMWLIALHKIGTHLGPPVLAFNWAGTLIQHKLLWGFQFPWIKASAVSLFQSSGRFPSAVICDVLFAYPYDSVFCVLLICCGEKGNVWAMWSSWAGLAAGLVWLRYRGISRAARWQLGDLCAPPCW